MTSSQEVPEDLPASASDGLRSPRHAGRARWVTRTLVAVGVAVVAGGALAAAVSAGPGPEVGPAQPPQAVNSQAAEFLEALTASPVVFEHALHAGRYGAQNVGRGYLDLSSECTIDGAYAGPIYQVELKHVAGSTWQRSYKQPTRMRADWAESAPLSGSVNSVLASLSGSSPTVLCGLGDLPLVLTGDGPAFTIDWDAVRALESSRRTIEIQSALELAGWPAEAAAQRVSSLSWALDEELLVASQVQLETDGSGGGRILVLGAGGQTLEEFLFWPTQPETVSPPVPPLSESGRAEQARAVVGPPPNSSA